MQCQKCMNGTKKIVINDYIFETVNKIIYLGVILIGDNRILYEINVRTKTENLVFTQIKSFYHSSRFIDH